MQVTTIRVEYLLVVVPWRIHGKNMDGDRITHDKEGRKTD